MRLCFHPAVVCVTWLRTSQNETAEAQSIAMAAAAIPACMACAKDCWIASRTSGSAPAEPPAAADEPARAMMRRRSGRHPRLGEVGQEGPVEHRGGECAE